MYSHSQISHHLVWNPSHVVTVIHAEEYNKYGFKINKNYRPQTSMKDGRIFVGMDFGYAS
jgi:hypothetical protein